MTRSAKPISELELRETDALYRAGGLKRMANPHIHYDSPLCPWVGCQQRLEWIDFKLESYAHRQRIYNPLVTAWWEGTSFAGRCPGCTRWVLFTTRSKRCVSDSEAQDLPQLPEDWHLRAQFA